jgi:hypothetical protein
VITILVTVLVGLWLSGRLTRQIVDLAHRVRQLDGKHAGEPLERHYPEREVAELAAAFDGYHERTVRLLERERAFTADVSHELRTPLTAIQTTCELMLDDTDLSARARSRVDKISGATTRLDRTGECLPADGARGGRRHQRRGGSARVHRRGRRERARARRGQGPDAAGRVRARRCACGRRGGRCRWCCRTCWRMR